MSSSSSSSSVPLASFMKNLLSESSAGSLSFSSADKIPLIVDNAKSCGSPRGTNRVMEDEDLPPFETSRKRNHNNTRKAYQSSMPRRQPGSSAPLPPVTRDSRWETSSRSAFENNSQHNPVPLPSRPVPGTFGSPAIALTKRKTVLDGTSATASPVTFRSSCDCESDDESQSSGG